jgi:hypothetical protein
MTETKLFVKIGVKQVKKQKMKVVKIYNQRKVRLARLTEADLTILFNKIEPHLDFNLWEN